jgi:hypothetical protein
MKKSKMFKTSFQYAQNNRDLLVNIIGRVAGVCL